MTHFLHKKIHNKMRFVKQQGIQNSKFRKVFGKCGGHPVLPLKNRILLHHMTLFARVGQIINRARMF